VQYGKSAIIVQSSFGSLESVQVVTDWKDSILIPLPKNDDRTIWQIDEELLCCQWQEKTAFLSHYQRKVKGERLRYKEQAGFHNSCSCCAHAITSIVTAATTTNVLSLFVYAYILFTQLVQK